MSTEEVVWERSWLWVAWAASVLLSWICVITTATFCTMWSTRLWPCWRFSPSCFSRRANANPFHRRWWMENSTAVLRWSEDVGITFLFWLRQTQRPSLHSSTANTEDWPRSPVLNNPVFVVIPNTCRWSRGTWTPSWSVRGEGYRSMSTEYANACQRTVA